VAAILLVDDDESLREVMKYHLEQDGHEVLTAENGRAGFELFTKHGPDVVVSDIVMPEIGGVELLKRIKDVSSDTMFVMITAHGSVESAVEAMRLGACDYLEKPFAADALKMSVKKALRVANLEKENKYLRGVAIDKYRFGNIVGASEAMKRVFETAARVAERNATVLILGESGSGKELLAKAIHFNSRRKDGPFIPVNVSAIPGQLIDSELFGHEKGAFTGAVTRHAGAFERASGGTIFLDEIAEMPAEHQVRLLRVLQEKEIVRVGGEKSEQVNARVIAATNRDLDDMVRSGQFRQDLYFRLSVVPIEMPPLRRRADDIPSLVAHFLEKHGAESGSERMKMSPEAMDVLMKYDWPGNVRELENAIERCAAITAGPVIAPEDLPEKIRQGAAALGLKAFRFELPEGGIVLEDVEKTLIQAALEKNNNNQSAAARYLGITRNTLLYRMDKFNLK